MPREQHNLGLDNILLNLYHNFLKFSHLNLKNMVPVKTYGSAVYGVEATTITVEVNISSGNKYFIVGLPDNAVKESLLRIESAETSSGCRMPRQKIVVNLAPADIRKEGSAYDLTIATGILAASAQIPFEE